MAAERESLQVERDASDIDTMIRIARGALVMRYPAHALGAMLYAVSMMQRVARTRLEDSCWRRMPTT